MTFRFLRLSFYEEMQLFNGSATNYRGLEEAAKGLPWTTTHTHQSFLILSVRWMRRTGNVALREEETLKGWEDTMQSKGGVDIGMCDPYVPRHQGAPREYEYAGVLKESQSHIVKTTDGPL